MHINIRKHRSIGLPQGCAKVLPRIEEVQNTERSFARLRGWDGKSLDLSSPLTLAVVLPPVLWLRATYFANLFRRRDIERSVAP